MSIVKIPFDSTDRLFYIMTSTNEAVASFCVVTRHPASDHVCAYLTVDKARWNQARDAIAVHSEVTYEGIGSAILNVPDRIMGIMPDAYHGYWIGVDYMFHEQPSEERTLFDLQTILETYSYFQ